MRSRKVRKVRKSEVAAELLALVAPGGYDPELNDPCVETRDGRFAGYRRAEGVIIAADYHLSDAVTRRGDIRYGIHMRYVGKTEFRKGRFLWDAWAEGSVNLPDTSEVRAVLGAVYKLPEAYRQVVRVLLREGPRAALEVALAARAQGSSDPYDKPAWGQRRYACRII